MPLLAEVPKPGTSTDDPLVEVCDDGPISSVDGCDVLPVVPVLPVPKPDVPLVPEGLPNPPLTLLGPVEGGSRLGVPVLMPVPPGGISPVEPLEGTSG
jgi:hypothetical protein